MRIEEQKNRKIEDRRNRETEDQKNRETGEQIKVDGMRIRPSNRNYRIEFEFKSVKNKANKKGREREREKKREKGRKEGGRKEGGYYKKKDVKEVLKVLNANERNARVAVGRAEHSEEQARKYHSSYLGECVGRVEGS